MTIFTRTLSAFVFVASVAGALTGCSDGAEGPASGVATLTVDGKAAPVDKVVANGAEVTATDGRRLTDRVQVTVLTENDVARDVALSFGVPREVGKYTCGSAKALELNVVWPEEPARQDSARKVFAAQASGEDLPGSVTPIGECEVEVRSVEAVPEDGRQRYRVRGSLRATAASARQAPGGLITPAPEGSTETAATKTFSAEFTVYVTE